MGGTRFVCVLQCVAVCSALHMEGERRVNVMGLACGNLRSRRHKAHQIFSSHDACVCERER